MIARLVYPIATLIALWSLSGGEMTLFWARMPVFALGWLVVGIGALAFKKPEAAAAEGVDSTGEAATAALPAARNELSKLRLTRPDVMTGLISGFATAIPFIAIAILAAKKLVSMPDFVQNSVQAFHGSPFWVLALAVLFLSPGAEIINRGILQPEWGLGTVAFLDALTIGFGIQQFAPFLTIWLMGLVWGALAQRSLPTAIVSRVFWTLLVFGTLVIV